MLINQISKNWWMATAQLNGIGLVYFAKTRRGVWGKALADIIDRAQAKA